MSKGRRGDLRSKIAKTSRDSILFFSGLAGIAHETLTTNKVEHPNLLLLFAAMVGLPAFLRNDERKKRNMDDDE